MKVRPPLEPSSASRATPPFPTSYSRAVAGLLPLALALAGCTTARDDVPATPPPHAFISYDAEPTGDDAVRVGVKDLINIKGEVTSAGSEYLYKNAKPAARDAACLRLIRQSDARIVGKTNLSEFAIGVTGSNDYFGTPINPLDPTRIPGGSSSGSAVAVAMGLADIALGTDTAGSIRVPAACCGIAGLKTTFGLISIEGVYPISPRYLDTVGPMAADVGGLVEGMKLLQPGFAAQYRQAKADKPLAKDIRIGRLRIPGNRSRHRRGDRSRTRKRRIHRRPPHRRLPEKPGFKLSGTATGSPQPRRISITKRCFAKTKSAADHACPSSSATSFSPACIPAKRSAPQPSPGGTNGGPCSPENFETSMPSHSRC